MPRPSDETVAPGREWKNKGSPKFGPAHSAVKPTGTGNLIDSREFVSVGETVRITSPGRTKVYELMACGDLEYIKIDKRRLIRRSSISALGDR